MTIPPQNNEGEAFLRGGGELHWNEVVNRLMKIFQRRPGFGSRHRNQRSPLNMSNRLRFPDTERGFLNLPAGEGLGGHLLSCWSVFSAGVGCGLVKDPVKAVVSGAIFHLELLQVD